MIGPSAGSAKSFWLTCYPLLGYSRSIVDPYVQKSEVCIDKVSRAACLVSRQECALLFFNWTRDFDSRHENRNTTKPKFSTYNRRRVAKNLRRPRLGPGPDSPPGKRVSCRHLREWAGRLIGSASHCRHRKAVEKKKKKKKEHVDSPIILITVIR